MRKIIRYRAFDGSEFKSSTKCIEYELNHNFYAAFTCIPFYNIEWTNISDYLNYDLISFACALYAFKANDKQDIKQVKKLFKALDLTTNGINEPGEYYLSWYDHGWERSNKK